MLRTIVLIAIVTGICATASAKSGRTYFTPERVATARENVAKYEWAQGQQRRIFETGDAIRYYIGPIYTSADTFVELSDDATWLLQPTTTIPRTYDVGRHPRAVCPEHGDAVKKHGTFNPWSIDPIGHPYQLRCPEGGEWYPSNKYHEGDLTSGDYPDDGLGCMHGGERYHFLIEYAHMAYGSIVVPTLKSLSEAYVLSDDPRYAYKGCILMARLAMEFPNYGWEGTGLDLEDRTDLAYMGPYGGTHPHYTWKDGGMISDHIWETFLAERIAYAYDALYPYFDDPDVLAFVKSKGMPVETGDDLRGYIESYILRACMVALDKGMIKGNEGHHQACALGMALVMDDHGDTHPNSLDMVEYAYHGIGRSAYMLLNGMARDGGGHESPGYNKIKFDFIRVAEVMEELRALHPEDYPEDRYPDLFAHPKAAELFYHHIDSLLCRRWLPPIGDTGGIRKPERHEERHLRYAYSDSQNLYAFRKYGDPRFARAMTRVDGSFFPGQLWEPYPEEELNAALADPASAITRESRLLDGYGVGILESGEWPNDRVFTVNYSSTVGHRQNDQLSIGLFARGLDLLPDIGYPRTWSYRTQWDAANMSHNTVTVNERSFTYPRFFRNGCRLFASQDGVHAVSAYHNPYVESTGLDVDLYERTKVMIDVDEERFYLVDLFAVSGGEQHDQSWHGLYVEPEAPDLDWQVQPTGTLAGPDVPEFAAYTDRFGGEHPKGAFPSYLTEIHRAGLTDPAVWTWRSGLEGDDGVALHIVPVGGSCEVITGKGRSPVWVEDKLDYVLVRRQTDGSPSHFLTVMDPLQGDPEILSVRVVSESPLRVEVTRTDGIDEITLHIPDGPSRTTDARPLGVEVKSTGRNVRIGGPDPGYAEGSITDLDYDALTITVEGAEADFPPGRAIRIYNEMRSAMFRITAVEPDGDSLKLTLDKTALMGRYPVVAVESGRLQLAVKSPFITGHISEEDGTLSDGANDFYYGCWIGEGDKARQGLGISNTKPAWLHVAPPHSDQALKDAYLDEVVSLWHYAIGDAVEVAQIDSDAP